MTGIPAALRNARSGPANAALPAGAIRPSTDRETAREAKTAIELGNS